MPPGSESWLERNGLTIQRNCLQPAIRLSTGIDQLILTLLGNKAVVLTGATCVYARLHP